MNAQAWAYQLHPIWLVRMEAGRPSEAKNCAPPRAGHRMQTALHHVELWTTDLAAAEEGWRWLLTTVGWSDGDSWTQGRTWKNPDGTYIVLEQSPDVMDGPHDRLRAGLNHLAINCSGVEVLESLRAGSRASGWRELFADRYPNAGGSLHTALFMENAQGFEVEVVSP